MGGSYKTLIQHIRKIFNKPEGIIPLHEPVFLGNEKKYIEDCIDSTFVSSVGKYVDKFEENISEYTNSKYSIATVNGTSALHIALSLCGVHEGDEVITQPLSFVATANAISYCHANPVFIDVDKDTIGLSPEKLESFLKENLRYDKKSGKQVNKTTSKVLAAIVPMHTFGNPCRIEDIVNVGNKYNIPVIEDAAESLGSKYKNQHTGTFGGVGIFSFNGNKVLTTGGGGMIITDDQRMAEVAKHITTQAKVPHSWDFFYDRIGYNYRMPNINAALGMAQLENLNRVIENKRKTALLYHDFFTKNNINYSGEIMGSYSNYWLNTILLESRNERDCFLSESNKNGIFTRPIWTMLNKLPMYSTCQAGDLFNSNELENTAVCLPSGYIDRQDSIII